MNYRIDFTSSAEKEFLKLPKDNRQRIGQHIEALADDPRPSGCVKLSGMGCLWRIRVGDYRILYSIQDVPMVVAITKIGHRREVYRGL